MLGRIVNLGLTVLIGAAPTWSAGLPAPLLTLYERMRPPYGLAQAAPEKPHSDGPRPRNADDPVWVALDAAYRALREEDLDAAIAGFERASALAPQRTDIRKDLAYTYLRTGENELARRQFERVTEIDPADWRSQLELAFLDYDAGTTPFKAAARELFVRVARDGDEASKATAARALAFIDSETALLMRPFQAAVELNPQDNFSRFRLGLFHEERNEYEPARRSYQLARQAGPSTVLDLAIGRVLIALGRREEAIRALRDAAAATDNLFVAEEAKELLSRIDAGVEGLP